MPGADAPAVGEQMHRVGIFKHCPALDDCHAGLLLGLGIEPLEAGDFLFLGAHQRRPIKSRFRHGPAETGRILESIMKAGGHDQELLGHAAADHAGAAKAELFRQHHPGAMPRRNPGSANAAGAAPDHEEINVEVRHRNGLSGRRGASPDVICNARFYNGGADASSSRNSRSIARKPAADAAIAATHQACQAP